MDNIKELHENALENNIEPCDLIEAGDNVQELKYSDDDDVYENTEASFEEVLMEDKTISLEVQSLKCESNTTSRENNFSEVPATTSGVSDPLVPSAAIAALEKNEICLDNPFSSDNFLKDSLDDECNSDMQDEEIQLRWDDDDDEVSFTEISIDEDGVEFAVQEIKMKNSSDINLQTQTKSASDEEKKTLSEGMVFVESIPENHNFSEAANITISVEKEAPSDTVELDQCEEIEFKIDSVDNSQDSIDIINGIEAVGKELPLTNLFTNIDFAIESSDKSQDTLDSDKEMKSVEKELPLDNVQMDQSIGIDFVIDSAKDLHDAKAITDEIIDSKKEWPLKNEKILQLAEINFKMDVSENSGGAEKIEVVEKDFSLETEQIDQQAKINFEIESVENSQDAKDAKEIEMIENELSLKTLQTNPFEPRGSTMVSCENLHNAIDISKEIEKGISINEVGVTQLPEVVIYNKDVPTEVNKNLPEANLVTGKEKLLNHNIFTINNEQKNNEFMVHDVLESKEMEQSSEVNLEVSKMVEECSEFKQAVIINNKEKEVDEKVIDVSSKQLIKGNMNLIEEKHVKNLAVTQAKTNTKLNDSVVETSVGILTQHGLKKPDVMLEIPTKELMNFMDEDDDDLCLLSSLAMSPDDADIEIDDHDDGDIKEVNISETPKNKSLTIHENDIQSPSFISAQISDNERPLNEIFTKEGKEVEELQSSEKNKPPDAEAGTKLVSVVDECQPSTSKASIVMEMRRDSDEVGEVSDSLGLLAESTTVQYDDEQDDDDYRDDEEDFYQDEESNQMRSEFSEESNAMHSESDSPKLSHIDSDNAQGSGEKDNIQTFECKEENEIFDINELIERDESKNEVARNGQTKNANKEELANNEISHLNQENFMRTIKIGEDPKIDTELHEVKMGGENKDEMMETNSQEDYEMDKEEVVLCLESSSDEESSQPKAKASLPANAETPNISEDMSRSSTPEPTQKSSSDSDMDNKAGAPPTTDPVKKTKKSMKGLEVFCIDSDEEDNTRPNQFCNQEVCFEEDENQPEVSRCINPKCKSAKDVQYYVADLAVCKFYYEEHKKDLAVCEPCVDAIFLRDQKLIEGIKNFAPLLDLHSGESKHELVEISDSESEEEEETEVEGNEKIGEKGAKIVEEELCDLFNKTWVKYKMDVRLDKALDELQDDLCTINAHTEELDVKLNDCQMLIDSIRNELYQSFPQKRKELPALILYDTPSQMYASYEEETRTKVEPHQTRLKRRMSNVTDTPSKRLAVVSAHDNDEQKVEIVKLSAEAAPADLPPNGEPSRPPLRVGLSVFAMRNAFGPWLKARVVEVQPKPMYASAFTMCRVKFDHKVNRNPFKLLPARCLAYSEPADVRLTIGTRVIASADSAQYYSGVVGEMPTPVNNYRYLVFFDDGHAKYVRHAHTRLVCEHSTSVWEEVHPNSREFIRQYLRSYPERPMVRARPGHTLKTEWNDTWHSSRVLQVDGSLVLVRLAGDRSEWIYRGSTRLAPLFLEMQAPRGRARPLPRSAHQFRNNAPYVEYTRCDDQQSMKGVTFPQQQQEDMKRDQRAIAKKSVSAVVSQAPGHTADRPDSPDVISKVVFYTQRHVVRPLKMATHQCSPKCKRADVIPLKDLRSYNPLAKPLLSGWERHVVRFKGHRDVMYRAPCGRRLRSMPELHRYLRLTHSDMHVDLFVFEPNVHCLAELVLYKCLQTKKDLSYGKENVPVPCVNQIDDTLPEFCSYNTERTPTAGVPLNLDPDFLCGCDCDDDCEDKTKCACWKMTIEGARTIGLTGDVGYVYRRLPEQLPSGIYECNSRCKCKNSCLNRVAQQPLQLKLQVFKTENRGWGIRALNDVPKGTFLCVYAGNLLTDATANLDGLNEGDEYLAELDYIEVVEQMKEGYEEDIPESLKKEDYSSEEEEVKFSKDEIDDDFQPGHVDVRPTDFKKRLRTRERRKKEEPDEEKDNNWNKEKNKIREEDNEDEECITISDDEEVAREPSRFMAQAGIDSKQLVSKNRSVRSYFGKDEACYIMDAKVQGNIGRYLNHSCCPNVFVQNVFVDTHDPRFPWVAFFALSHIRAGTELTWNYNYDVGSVPGKVLYCHCGSDNCKGRLL